ncbi:DUF4349 domain-containing protein [Chloroflexota bacterium]
MRKVLMIIGLLLVTVVLLLASCSAASTSKPPTTPTTPTQVAPMPPSEGGFYNDSKSGAVPPVVITTPGTGTIDERMIVRTGDISLVVTGVPVAIDQITVMTEGFDGYVVSSNVWKVNERLVGSITIRVPAEHFDTAMKALRGLAVDVTSETSSSQDVTEEYTDLSARLHNLEATEVQLLKIMEKAETVEEILDVQRELSNTRGEIERTKARMQYLERTSATSLITVRLEQSGLSLKSYASNARLKVREPVRFYAEISGGFAPYSYEWDFGDGTTSTDEAPTHAYKAAGSYTISLTVTDDRGNTESETRTDYITVLPGWSAGNIASSAWNGLVTFGHVLVNILIWAGIFSPVWIVIGGIVYWQVRRRRKKAQ